MHRRLYAAVAAVGVVVGTLTGGLSLVDWVGNLFDDPAPPAVIDARLRHAHEVAAQERLDDYLSQTGQKEKGFTPADLRERGRVFEVAVAIEGEVGSHFQLRWKMYRAESDEPVPGSTYDQVAADVVPESPTHRQRWPVWIPHPQRPGTYYVRFTLQNNRGQPVDHIDTKRFHD
jgi:hypothetical protein